jgi:hypothetical protein
VTNSDEESKNVLTVVPFVNWSNLLYEYEDAKHETKKELSDLFSVGVKFGIPVKLGRKAE